jgi:hypothetical protein
MALKQGLKRFSAPAAVVIVTALIGVACVSSAAPPGENTPEAARTSPTPTDAWSVLLHTTPYPYSTPLPPPARTALDGTYTKIELKEGTPVPCKRCPDYAPEGGLWKLNLDKGVFRILYAYNDWRSLASFTVSGDQLTLFNDPNCPQVVGTYTWKLEEGKLTFKVVEDECSIRLRAMNLTHVPWLSCHPPTTEAAISDHWPKPAGCD